MVNPTTYTELIDKYRSYIATPPLFDLDVDPATGETKVRLTLEFVPHPTFGSTKLRIRERYDSSGNRVLYRYCWEINSKPTGNISAWEN